MKLDDLADLGVTALFLYPVIQNDQGAIGKYLPTGYRPKDYFRVDENFGDLPALRRLVDEAHARGLRVILDLPLGMPGFEHPYVTDPDKAGWFGEPTRIWRAPVGCGEGRGGRLPDRRREVLEGAIRLRRVPARLGSSSTRSGSGSDSSPS